MGNANANANLSGGTIAEASLSSLLFTDSSNDGARNLTSATTASVINAPTTTTSSEPQQKGDWFLSISEIVDKVSQFLDTYNSTADKLKDDAWVKAAVTGAKQVVSSIPGALTSLSGFAQHAPLVGVAFAVLNTAGKHIAEVGETRVAYNSLYDTIMTTGRLVLAVEAAQAELGITLGDGVNTALNTYWEQLEAFVELQIRFSDKSWINRLWTQSENLGKLKAMEAKIEQARKDLQLVLGIDSNGQLVQIRMQLSVDSAVLRTLAAQVRQLLQAQLPQPPGPIDEDKYARIMIDTFGALLSSADALGVEGSGFRPLSLHSVFIPQNVRECDQFDPSLLDLPYGARDVIKQLQESGQLQPAQRGVEGMLKALRLFERQPIRGILQLFDDPAIPRAVVLGSPGAGKTSALREGCLQWALTDAPNRGTLPFPVLVELRQYGQIKKIRPQIALLDYIAEGGSVCLPIQKEALVARLESSTIEVLAFLDGLDEIFDPDLRDLVIHDIAVFAKTYDKGNRFCVTSRIIGYKQSDLRQHGFTHYLVLPFNDDQIERFTVRWHHQTYTATEANLRDQRLKRLQDSIDDNPSVHTLARNPLLLTMIAIVNRVPELPSKRVQLYEECVKLLLARWKVDDAVLRISIEARSPLLAIKFEQKAAMLRHLAERIQKSSTQLANVADETLVLSSFEADIRARLPGAQNPRVLAEAVIEQLQRSHGVLCWLGGRSYAFMHRTFLEYFSALDIANRIEEQEITKEELPPLFKQHANDPTWAEVLCLLCGMIPSVFVGPCLQQLLAARNVELAARCVEELREPHKAFEAVNNVRAELQELIKGGDLYTGRLRSLDRLANIWRDETSRIFLMDLAGNGVLVSEIVAIIANYWKDETSRAWLEALAVSDNVAAPAAVLALSGVWRDGTTRALLEKIILHHPAGAGVARACLEDLERSDKETVHRGTELSSETGRLAAV